MIEDFEFIWFSRDSWGKRKARKHLLAQALSKDSRVNKVLFIEPPVRITELIDIVKTRTMKDENRARWLRALSFKTIIKLSDKFYLHTPLFFVPFERFRLTYNLNRLLSSILIKFITKPKHIKRIVWLYHPYDYLLLRLFPRAITVFDWTEDWAEYHIELSPKKRNQMKELELKIVKNVDLVFTVSDSLLKVARQYNPNSYRIPNATAFAKMTKQDVKIAEEIKNIQKPIIGHVGNICDRTDLELINRLANELPKCSVVLIGGTSQGITESDISHLTSKNNVYYLGLKEHSQLPKYLKSFDVCLMLYRPENTKTGDPTKLYDYLATGKPIVSTKFVGVKGYEKYVRIAETHEEYIEGVRESLNKTDQQFTQDRLKLALENSWEARVQQVLDILGKM